ncbi:MAG: T9SS type A sorting domain-containing protein [Bacteroidota bacterium]
MKKFIAALYTCLLITTAFSQTGPGGFGTKDGTSDLVLWLKADAGVLNGSSAAATNGEGVGTWQDQSGYGLQAISAATSPTYTSSNANFNGLPSLTFSGGSTEFLFIEDDADEAPQLDNTSGIAIFYVYNPDNSSGVRAHLSKRDSYNNQESYTAFENGSQNSRINSSSDVGQNINSGTTYINAITFQNGTFEHFLNQSSGGTNSGAASIPNNNSDLNIGTFNPGDSRTFDGDLAEIIIFRKHLSNAERIVVENYLGSKYGLSLTYDFWDEATYATYDNEMAGIGQHTDGAVAEQAMSGSLSISGGDNRSGGEWLFWGHDNADFNTYTTTEAITGSGRQRLAREWVVNETGDMGNVTVSIDENNLPATGVSNPIFYLLVDSDGDADFSDATPLLMSKSGTISSVLLNVSDGDHLAIAYEEGQPAQTWYSFVSGSWNDPAVWTLDGATTPIYDNDAIEVPGPEDVVIITPGRTISMLESDNTTILDNILVQSLTIKSSAELALLTSSGHSLGAISGGGTLSLQGSPNQGLPTAYVENLPNGNYINFADPLLGGTIELNTATDNIPLIINQEVTGGIIADANGALSRSLVVNMGDADDEVILQRDVYLNKEFTLTQGRFRIHKNNSESYANVTWSDADLELTVAEDINVGSNASITTGDANQRHQFNSLGDFVINGAVSFTQRLAPDYDSEATDGIVDLNFLATTRDQKLTCNGVSNFYRIEINKATPIYQLHITTDASGNFNLFGSTNYSIDSDLTSSGSNQNALGLITGTVRLGADVSIPHLNNGSNYAISSRAQLWVDGGSVRKTVGPALVPYGTFKITSGLAEFLVQSGITLRDAGSIIVEGGELYANAIRTSIQASGDVGAYIQTGGKVVLNGGTGVGSTTTGSGGTNSKYYVFTLSQPENVFQMTGGTLEIQRSNFNDNGGADTDPSDDLGGGIFINSDVSNQNVTGGTVIMNTDNTVPFRVTSKAPFFDVVMTNSGGAGIVDNNSGVTEVLPDDDNIIFLAGGQVGNSLSSPDAVMTAQPLVVLNDLTIGDGTNALRFDHLGNDVTIGRNFTIEVNAEYYFGDDALLPINQPNNNATAPASHQNTTTFNGTISGLLTFSNLTSDDDANNEQLFHNLIINKSSDASISLTAPNKPSSGNSSNALRIAEQGSFRLESGTVNQGDRSIRFFGDVYNASVLGVFVPGVTNTNALLKFRPSDFTIETEPGAEFGNFRLNSSGAVISLDNDVTIRRVEFRHGRLNIQTHNVIIDELDVNLSSSASYSGTNRIFSVQDMIITSGNYSDGGLTLKVTGATNPTGGFSDNIDGNSTLDALDDEDFLFPLGIGTTGDANSKYTPALISLTSAGDLGSDGEAYITVNPVQGELLTTDLTGGEILDYYWRVRTDGFDADPTIDFIQFFGDDDDVSTPGNLTSYVSGSVLDAGTYQRSSESNTVTDPASPGFEDTDFSILFDGEPNGTPFTLEDASFTAGEAGRFTGTPQIFYSRVVSSNYNITSMPQWSDGNTWSLVSHTGTAAGDWPQDGDIAIVGEGGTGGGSGGPRHHVAYRTTDNYSLAKVEINNDLSQSSWDPRLFVEEGATFNMGIVDGNATLEIYISNSVTSTINGDFGSFSSRGSEGARVLYLGRSGSVIEIPQVTDVYPNVRLEGGGAREFYFPNAVTINNELRVDNSCTLRPRYDLYVKGDLRLGNYLYGILEFPNDTEIKVETEGRLRVLSDDASAVVVENDNTSMALTHQLMVHGDIELTRGNQFDLWNGNGANDDNCVLEIKGGADSEWTNSDNMPIELYRLVINKGTDATYRFDIQDNGASNGPTLNGPTNLADKSLEIVNGTLGLYDEQIDWLLTSGGGDFYLPNLQNGASSSGSGAIELYNNTTLRIEGDDTGLRLDGKLVLSGGDVDLSSGAGNGNNFIEYSASGNAQIRISDANSTLSVGSQIRRGFFSEAGVLDLQVTDGLLEIGASTEGDGSRGMLEILNANSNFTHTGGAIRFLNQNGVTASDAAVASLLLDPATSNLTGSTIEIDLNESNDLNFSISSSIPLNNLKVMSSTGASSEVVQLKTRPLTIAGDLSLQNDVELKSNGWDLTLQGDFVVDNTAFYTPGTNKTFFEIGASQTNQLTGTNTDDVTFYNLEKVGAGTLQLAKNMIVSGVTLDLLGGTIDDNGNTIDFTGQVFTNDATHSSPASVANGGIRMSGTSGSQVLVTSSKGIFGNLTINNTNGVAVPDFNQTFLINRTLTLADGILDIGPALLEIANNGDIVNGAGSNANFSDFSETNQIQTNSSIIDFGLQKDFDAGATTNFMFPVGEGNRYTPVRINFGSGNSGTTAGTLRVRPRNAVAPVMLGESAAIQDAILQYHWLVNAAGFTGFEATLEASYDDDVIGTDSESSYQVARALFSDPGLNVENPAPGSIDIANNVASFTIINTSVGDNFSGEYFAGDPSIIPDVFKTFVFDGTNSTNYSDPGNYFKDNDGDHVFSVGDERETTIGNVSGGVVEIADGTTLVLDQNGTSFSRLIIPTNGVLEVDGTNGHLLGQVSGSGTIRMNSDGSTVSLPAGDYLTFFDCTSGGGALEYGGSGDYTILVEINQVRQLTINGSGEKTFVNTGNINICEDMIINAGTVDFSSDKEVTIDRDFILNSGAVSLATNGVLTVQNDVQLLGGSFTGSANSVFNLYGDLTKTGATIQMTGANASTLSLVGATTQNITGDFSGTDAISDLVVNNTTSGVAVSLTGGTTLEIESNLTLTDGIILTDNTDFTGTTFTINNVLVFATGSTFTGGSNESFVDGVIRKKALPANTTFTFPTGDGSVYAPVIVNEDATGGTDWHARYVAENPFTLSSNTTNIPLIEVSSKEYWVVETTSPQSATISLVYGSQSDVVTPNETTVLTLKDVGVDGLNSSDTWEDIGRGGLSAGASSSGGTLTASDASSFSSNFYTIGGQTDTALPVELLTFEGKAEENRVSLYWATASEVNNNFFEVQRSRDGETFETIGTVEGSGTTNEIKEYRLMDRNPGQGDNYYRLKQVDFDGKFEYHETIRVVNDFVVTHKLDAAIYPNPVVPHNMNLRLETSDNENPLSVQIVNLGGQTYYNEVMNATGYVDKQIQPTQTMNAGLYFLIVKQGGNVKKQKLIIRN